MARYRREFLGATTQFGYETVVKERRRKSASHVHSLDAANKRTLLEEAGLDLQAVIPSDSLDCLLKAAPV